MNLNIWKLTTLLVVFLIALFASRQARIFTQPAVMSPEAGTHFLATDAYHAMKWYNDQRAYPSGRIPLDWRQKAEMQISQSNLRKSTSTSSIAWKSVGPSDIGGRVRSIVINPLNSSTIYCGSVSGGIWKSMDAGATWNPTSDLAANLVIGCMAIDPVDTNIIYAGTGEGYFNVDALRGAGVLKSTDGGASWTLLSNFINPASLNYYYINKIIIRPDAHNTLFAGTLEGIWKTTNAGTSWNQLSVPSQGSVGCADLVIKPTTPNIMYASFGLFRTNGIYKTTDGGSTWTKLAGGLPTTNYHRISLALSTSNPATIYAAMADSNNGTLGIYRTTTSGTSWTKMTTPVDNSAQVNGGYLWTQGWYANVIAVDPTNSNALYAGGVNLFKSTDGGANWSRISDGYVSGSTYVHVDQHAIAFDPHNNITVYFGNDGGMFKTTTAGGSFFPINSNLAITQFYSGAVDPLAEIYYGGTQDNGTVRTLGPPLWTVVHSGDGGTTAVDYLTPPPGDTESLYLSLLKSTSSGGRNTWTRIMNGIPSSGSPNGTSDRCAFIAPYTMDPTDPLVLVAGTYRVFRSSNGGGSWSAISNDLTGNGPGAQQDDGSVITEIAISKSYPSTIYAGTSGFSGATGSTSSRVWVENYGTTSWVNHTAPPLPDRSVTWIAIDPVNADRAFVCYSGYGTGHIFQTTNRGLSWTDASGNLPDIPVNTMVVDPASLSHLIVGTDLGVFESLNGGCTWSQQNIGLANVSVVDLDLRGDQFLFASTHGRGMFKTSGPINSVPSTHLTIAIHQNPLLTRYVDIIVASDTLLASSPQPSVRVTVGGGAADQPAVTELSPQVFKASYGFQSNGTAVITAVAYDSGGSILTGDRTFTAQLAKQGVAQSVQTGDGNARVGISADALTEDTYFTIVPENDRSEGIVSRAYTFGPERSFPGSMTVSIAYDQARVVPGTEEHLSIVQFSGTAWNPVKTTVDPSKKTASARVSTLGKFAVAFSPQTASGLIPSAFTLGQNYPNPFNPKTNFGYQIGR